MFVSVRVSVCLSNLSTCVSTNRYVHLPAYILAYIHTYIHKSRLVTSTGDPPNPTVYAEVIAGATFLQIAAGRRRDLIMEVAFQVG